MFARVRWHLLGWNVLVLVLILALVGGAVYAVLAHTLVAEVDRNLASHGEEAVLNLREMGEQDIHLAQQGYQDSLFYLLVSPAGQILANPQQVNPATILPSLLAGVFPHYVTTTANDDESTRLYVQPISTASPPGVRLIVGQSLASEQRALHRVLLGLLIGGGLGVLLSLLGAWFLAGRALVPIELAFRRQQDFVADASHELRTPLTILHSATDLLGQHRSEPLEANRELFEDVRQEIGHLERLVSDLFTLARSDLQELELAVAPLDLAGLAGETVQRTHFLTRDRGIGVTLGHEDVPLIVEADPDRLQQVLLILFDNALKHTPTGGKISVLTRRQGINAVLQVVDTGEGISAEHLPRVFDRFYRGDRVRSRSSGGTGLGLAIANALVDAHGGHLTLESAPGRGTTAIVRLPMANAGKLE